MPSYSLLLSTPAAWRVLNEIPVCLLRIVEKLRTVPACLPFQNSSLHSTGLSTCAAWCLKQFKQLNVCILSFRGVCSAGSVHGPCVVPARGSPVRALKHALSTSVGVGPAGPHCGRSAQPCTETPRPQPSRSSAYNLGSRHACT